MSVRSMIDRAEIPAHRLLQSHHSNEPEREMDRWMKGKRDEKRHNESVCICREELGKRKRGEERAENE